MKHLIKILFFTAWFIPFFDTGLFIYPSLSHSLLWGVLSCFTLSLICLFIITKRDKLHYTNGIWIVILYISYLIIHSFFIKTEYYRLYYYLSGFIYLLVVYYSCIEKYIIFSTIKKLLIIGLLIQLTVILGQALQFLESKSPYFLVTGCCENPNVTAMYIALAIPFIADDIHNKRHIILFSGLLILSLAALYLLNCRTAWLAIIVPFFIYGVRPIFNIIKIKSLQKTFIISCFTFFVLFMSFLYQHKYDSTNGRTLIWELSLKEIIHKPQGNGYGRFASVYNSLQSNYFRNETSSATERQNARYTAMAYNDYLESGVDGGIGGMILHILLIFMFVIISYRQRNKVTFSIFLMVSIMSCVNFFIISIQPWIVFLMVAGYTLSVQQQKVIVPITHRISCLLGILFTLFICYKQIQFIQGQYILAKPQAKESNQLLLVSDFIGTSEAYHRTVAQYYTRKKDWKNAILHCDEALLYTSQPSIFQMKAHALLQENKIKEAEDVLQHLRYMIPTQLRCKHLLLQIYNKHQMTEKAHEIAHEILAVRPKILSQETIRIQKVAQEYLNHIHHDHKHDK